MPSLETAKRISSVKYNAAKTLGQIHKEESDWLMEETWEEDLESKICYIYDYFHDDQPLLKDHMTYENTTKTMIDAKFIVKSYQSIDKDQVEYYVQFKPSQKNEFSEEDELYYFETDYRSKYGNDDFIGLYIDIPDDKGIYRKWLICSKEPANQFVKYLILPVTYNLNWIEKVGQNRYKRKMWAVLRNQNSYTIGVYTDRYFTRPDNQQKIWLPLNSITEKLWYNDEDSKTMRLIISAPTENPIVFAVTKIENVQPFGLQKLTIYQKAFNPHTDYIEKDSNGKIIGMWADYYGSNVEVIDPMFPELPPSPSIYGKIIASTFTIKVGGSYKTLTLKLYDKSEDEITSNYSECNFEWSCCVQDGNETVILTDEVTWLKGSSFNQRKIKFPDNRKYLEKLLRVKCVVTNENETIETVEQFELVI